MKSKIRTNARNLVKILIDKARTTRYGGGGGDDGDDADDAPKWHCTRKLNRNYRRHSLPANPKCYV